MKFYEIFSKRQKRIRGQVPDVYQCESIPEKLRIQIVHLWNDVFGQVEFDRLGYTNYAYDVFKYLEKKISREYGMFSLGKEEDPLSRIAFFFLNSQETEKIIDIIELTFRCIDPNAMDNEIELFTSNIPPDKAINELNYRLREHGVGYQYEAGKIIKVDSQFVHSEMVKPALSFLSDPMYKGANEEFLNAHQHYRKHRYKECMNDCLKAFESCLKGICKKREWHYDEKRHTAKDLIDIVFDNELIPTYLVSHFSAMKKTLQNTLTDGLPTVRNRESGHGQGPEITTVPEYLAAYALHLTASNILLLAKADEELK